MQEVKRIAPAEVYRGLKAGTTLLVCAYDDEELFKRMQLAGAISLKEFNSRLPTLAQSQEIIFYCGWPHEHTSASLAAQYLEKGYKNAAVIDGGVEAWKKAGYSWMIFVTENWHKFTAFNLLKATLMEYVAFSGKQ